MNLSKGAFYLAAGVLSLSLAFAVNSCQQSLNPVSEGADYLTSQGYQVVGGGEQDFINTCGEDVFARSYEVITPAGKAKEQTVCFSPLFGTHKPLLGGGW